MNKPDNTTSKTNNERFGIPEPGNPAPIGITVSTSGVNFSVFSKYAEAVELLLFAGPNDPEPQRILRLESTTNRSNYYWHIFVPGIGHGQVYAWRIYGPNTPDYGHRFDGSKVLLDPYGLGITGLDIYDRQRAREHGDNCSTALRSVVIDSLSYDWEGDLPIKQTTGREVIYEMHVAGFTKDPSCDITPEKRGTYAGLIEKIPHLLELGVTTVELLPVHHFDPQDGPRGLSNFWGYSSVSYFAPHSAFSSDTSPAGPVTEFKDLVKALHKAGIRIILDVVYNHTAEGGSDGPTLCWRGFENIAYYMSGKDLATYADFTGCGNTINANHSIVRRMIKDSLRYWVGEMHVDGFRFDLASALARGEDGEPLKNVPLLWGIESDPVLADTTLIAEAWDAAGLYQVGSFNGDRFAEWNGPFRDGIRRFLRGDDGQISNLMARIVGSPDLFKCSSYRPTDVVNFVTCHDGFSLADLVSYNKKHNLDNRENDRDGTEGNNSWNCGVEGATTDPEVLKLRDQQMRNFLCLLFLSHGTPMILMGDEVFQSHLGNNNPWCQDNELNWYNWNLLNKNAEIFRFTRLLIKLTSSLTILQENRFWAATSPTIRGDVSWHGQKLALPNWNPDSHNLAFTLAHSSGSARVHVILNAEKDNLEFELPKLSKKSHWVKVIDTAKASPDDITEPQDAAQITTDSIKVSGHSVVVTLEQLVSG